VAVATGGDGDSACSGGAIRVPYLGWRQHGRPALRCWGFRDHRSACGLRGPAGAVVGATRSIATLLSAGSSKAGGVSSSARHTAPRLFAIHTNGLQHFGWDLYLLIVSLGLVWVGSRVHARGLGYVGGFGLLAFLISVSAQITRLESGRAPTTSVVGWPLALLIVGVLGLAAPALYRDEPENVEIVNE
jgi:hypothetical protein